MTIDELARQITINLGFDPDNQVSGSIRDTMTPIELEQNHNDAYTTTQKWKFYRGEAALALAIHKAIKITPKPKQITKQITKQPKQKKKIS